MLQQNGCLTELISFMFQPQEKREDSVGGQWYRSLKLDSFKANCDEMVFLTSSLGIWGCHLVAISLILQQFKVQNAGQKELW